MVVKKGKSKKTSVKKKAVKKAVNKDDLKKLLKRYLKERKKRTKPKEYKKIRDNLSNKVNNASSVTDITRLITLLSSAGKSAVSGLGGTVGGLAGQVSSGNIGERLDAEARKLRETVDDTVKKVKKKEQNVNRLKDDYKEIKQDINNLKDKYNNGTLEIDDLVSVYKKTRKFASDVQEELPTWEQLKTLYEAGRAGGKKGMEYIKRFLNRNRPVTESPVDLSQTSPEQESQDGPTPTPPAPPPAQTPTPTPTPPTQSPTPPPTLSNVADTLTAPIRYLNSLTGSIDTPTLLAGMGLAGGIGAGGLGAFRAGRQFARDARDEQDRLARVGDALEERWRQFGGRLERGNAMRHAFRALEGGIGNEVVGNARGWVVGGIERLVEGQAEGGARGIGELPRAQADLPPPSADLSNLEEELSRLRGSQSEQSLAQREPVRGLDRNRARDFRTREVERQVRQDLGEAQTQQARQDLSRQGSEQSFGSGLELEEPEADLYGGIFDMQQRMIDEGQRAGIQGASDLISNFGQNLARQMREQTRLDEQAERLGGIGVERADLPSLEELRERARQADRERFDQLRDQARDRDLDTVTRARQWLERTESYEAQPEIELESVEDLDAQGNTLM
jgi:hypothetical protein